MDDAQAHTVAAKAEWVRAAVEEHGARLTRYAASILGDDDTARDVVQDTFLRLCDEPPEKLDGRLAPWLFTVCRRRALDCQRKQKRMHPLAEDDLERRPSPDPDPAERAELDDTVTVVRRLLSSLSPIQQELIRLKFQAGLSYQEISEVTELSVGNVGFILHGALKSLRSRAARSL